MILSLFGGLAMFLFGMNLMGKALEKNAGNQLKNILGKMTSNPWKGFLLGLAVTAIIQSSSATTVMVVGFVNSGVMTLAQSIGIIMGANLGAAVTPLLLSTSAIEGGAGWLALLKISSITAVLAAVGIILYAFQKNEKKKSIGMILLGFAVLMFGMESMSAAVSESGFDFSSLFRHFENPLLGLLMGIVVTAAIQSSGASIGILQALSTAGAIRNGMAIPIIMGQNIGTCISAMISSVGANRNAKRAAVIHLSVNVIGAAAWVGIYSAARYLILPGLAFWSDVSNPFGIAIINIGYKVVSLFPLLPFTGALEKLADKLVPGEDRESGELILDDRLLSTPSLAVARCDDAASTMAALSFESLRMSLRALGSYDQAQADEVRRMESEVDMYEDKLGTYLVKLSGSSNMTENDSHEVTKLLHVLGDIERISDHAVNVIESAEEVKDKGLHFSDRAKKEIEVLCRAIDEIVTLTAKAFISGDMQAAAQVEPLEQVVDHLRDEIKDHHVIRLQNSECTIELGFVLSDILTNLERVSDHCSNIAGCIIEISHNVLDMHSYLQSIKSGGDEFNRSYQYYLAKYTID